MKIYYEGNLDYIATYRTKAKRLPGTLVGQLKPELNEFYNKLNFFFANSRWPRRDEA